MIRLSQWRKLVAGAAIVAVAAGCNSRNSNSLSDTSGLGAATQAQAMNSGELDDGQPLKLTTADLDGFEKGLEREVELVRADSVLESASTTPQERAKAIQAKFASNTIPAAAPVTGLSVERYRLVRETLSKLLTTLDFQGQIEGPQSLDTSHANPAMRERLASDPYQALDPASAAEFKSRLSRIVPLWVEYVNLTAVGG